MLFAMSPMSGFRYPTKGLTIPIPIPILDVFIFEINTDTQLWASSYYNTKYFYCRYQYQYRYLHLGLNDTNTRIWAIPIPCHFSVLFSFYALYCMSKTAYHINNKSKQDSCVGIVTRGSIWHLDLKVQDMNQYHKVILKSNFESKRERDLCVGIVTRGSIWHLDLKVQDFMVLIHVLDFQV